MAHIIGSVEINDMHACLCKLLPPSIVHHVSSIYLGQLKRIQKDMYPYFIS